MLTPMSLTWILLLNTAATWYMTGLVWFVQLVHYPQFALVGTDAFTAYHKRHMETTGWAVGPAMLMELLTAIALVIWRPVAFQPWIVWLGLVMVIVLWLSTACVQVPLHNQLSKGWDAQLAIRLCNTNWLRTAVWTARGILMLYALSIAVGPLAKA